MADQESPENADDPEHVRDIETLTRTELAKRYTREYSSWRNRKHHASKTGNWSPEFEDFGNFLRIMGPSRPGDTLDRIDVGNPYYGPNECRWASKAEQANNRSTTVYVEHEGKRRPVTDVCTEIGANPDTVRKRMRRGWTDEAALDGGEAPDFGRDPRRYKPWPRPDDPVAQRKWDDLYEQSGGERLHSRYAFLIKRLRAEAATIRSRLLPFEALHPEEWPEEIQREHETLLRVTSTLERAELEKPRWDAALRTWLSTKARRSPIGELRYYYGDEF